MGLTSAMQTALSGMTAAETTIDVVGNNLANANTVGFKASEAAFANQFLQTLSLGGAPTANSGGTNPRQIGLGTMVAAITPNFSQGTIGISSSPTDLAIQGDGFFIVEDQDGEQLYTRNGIFKFSSQNEMVTMSGSRLLGYGVDEDFQIERTDLVPVSIPLGSTAVAQATENVYLEGTLSPTGDLADTAEIIQTEILYRDQLDLPTSRIIGATALVDVLRRDGAAYEQVFAEQTLQFTGRKGGRLLTTHDFEITAATTVADLISFMEGAMGIQATGDDPVNPIPSSRYSSPPPDTVDPGGSVTTDGRIQLVGNNGVDNAIDIGLLGMQMVTASGTTRTVNMPWASAQAAVGESAVADFLAYDSLGIPLDVRLTAVMESRDSTSTTYRWFADSPGNDPASGVELSVGTGLIRFDGEGNVVDVSESRVSIERRNVSSTSPMQFELDFSQLSGLAADSSSLAVSRQDGLPPGVLTSFMVGEDGIIRGVFSNGGTRDLGQLQLARFTNPAGLEQRAENVFAEGVNSGLPVQGNPGQRGIGTLIAGAVELSNTDIGGNLIDLILASTMYRGNTRVITTAQQMIDELLALRR